MPKKLKKPPGNNENSAEKFKVKRRKKIKTERKKFHLYLNKKFPFSNRFLKLGAWQRSFC
jgi:hypothetical protein